MATTSSPSAAELRAAFDAPAPLTIGLEEELMLLEPASLDLFPRAREILDRTGGDARFKLELPAAQLEIVVPPARTVGEAVAGLADGRRRLASAAAEVEGARPAAAAMHPFASPLGELNAGDRYGAIVAEYGSVARRQLVGSLQVHVAVGGADRTLAVYNALRGHLPELAALAASAPFVEGRDTGLASARPLVAAMLPRQGMPPALESWDAFAAELSWGAAAGSVPELGRWWWELRPHARFGTLELRVPDVQATVAGAAAVAAFAHSLVAWLAERHDAGEPLGAPASWRIAENRWTACRHGVEGAFADLETGERRAVRDVLAARLDELAPVAARLGCAAELESARDLVEVNGAMRLREIGSDGGPRAIAAWLADSYLTPADATARERRAGR